MRLIFPNRQFLALMFHTNRIGSLLLWGSIGFLCLLVVHDFSVYIDRYPYLAVDDSLVNVAFALAKEGRYGFLASPLQAPGDGLRHLGFFNYGPWYFYFGAFLIWLFGYSLALVRSIHLLVLIVVIVLGYFWFKRNGSSLPAALAALGILAIFQVVHWPMVRPDIFVTLFAILFVIAAGNAIRSSRNSGWFWVGLFASCAALTHLIAWAMVPAAFLVWLRNEYGLARENGSSLRIKGIAQRFFLLGLGGMLGALMFYASFDFRFQDHWATVTGYRALVETYSTSTQGGVRYFEVLGKHIDSAFGFLTPRNKTVVLAIPLLGWGLWLGLLRWGTAQIRRDGEALLFPPLLALTAYLLSLGMYPNFHAGYAILTQIMLLWLAASMIGASQLWLSRYASRLASACSTVMLAVGLVVVAGMISSQLHAESAKSSQARQWVSISDLMRELVADIPKRGTAWGSIVFGAENPATLQLIQFRDGARLYAAVSPAERQRLAPDYLFWGYPESRDSTILLLRDHVGVLAQVDELLSAERYKLAKLVYAKPYGSTRIYQRVSPEDVSVLALPQIGMYLPGPDYWLRPDWRALDAVFESVNPVRLGIGYDANPPLVSARESRKTTLPAGNYVFRVLLTRSSDAKVQPGFLAITDQLEAREQISELGPKGDIAPHLSNENEVFLVRMHSGGNAYISYYGGNGFKISKIEVFPLRGADEPQRLKERTGNRKLPEFSDWAPSSGVKLIKDGRRYELQGDNTQWGYQLASQPIAVSPKSAITVQLDYDVISGKVCAGILDEKSNWLVAADRSEKLYEFNSAGNSSIQVVFANCNQQADGNKTSRVLLNEGTYRVISSRIYIDDLVSEFKTSLGNRR